MTTERKQMQEQSRVVNEAYIIYLYIYIYISLQIMNIWHYIHPHYRYDIQEMKIVLAKELPFFI